MKQIYRHAQHRNWVRLASLAGMSCTVCMVLHAHRASTPCAALQDVSTPWGGTLAVFMACLSMWPFERSVHVTSDFHCEWAIVASYANNGIDGWNLAVAIKEVQQFVSSQWVVDNSFWINEWRKISLNKSRVWLTARRTRHIDKFHSKLVYHRARSGSPQ